MHNLWTEGESSKPVEILQEINAQQEAETAAAESDALKESAASLRANPSLGDFIFGGSGANGYEHVPLDERGVRKAAREMRKQGIEAVAVCFLHAYANPAHERRAGEIIREEAPAWCCRPPARCRRSIASSSGPTRRCSTLT